MLSWPINSKNITASEARDVEPVVNTASTACKSFTRWISKPSCILFPQTFRNKKSLQRHYCISLFFSSESLAVDVDMVHNYYCLSRRHWTSQMTSFSFVVGRPGETGLVSISNLSMWSKKKKNKTSHVELYVVLQLNCVSDCPSAMSRHDTLTSVVFTCLYDSPHPPWPPWPPPRPFHHHRRTLDPSQPL